MKRLAVAAFGLVLLAGCVPQRHEVVQTDVTETVVHTVTPPTRTFVPPAPRTASELPPTAKPAKGNVVGRCPWIASSPDQNRAVNVADLNGSHVYRTTITTTKPTGCAFYFYASPYQAQVDIAVRTFSTAAEAHDAIVLTARAGTQQQAEPGIIPGVDAVLYRTKFFAPDRARDWACVFAAGPTMVIVRTDRTDTSLNALLIAKAIAPRF
jgi:hypothetical protein